RPALLRGHGNRLSYLFRAGRARRANPPPSRRLAGPDGSRDSRGCGARNKTVSCPLRGWERAIVSNTEGSNMRVYYDRDADLNLIKGKKVGIVGYGSQGRAHALNLKDSGVKEIAIGLKPGSATARKVEADGLQVKSVSELASWADLIMMATPDELQADIYRNEIAPNIRDGAAIAFAHGLNVHFGLIEPKSS